MLFKFIILIKSLKLNKENKQIPKKKKVFANSHRKYFNKNFQCEN